MTARAEPTCHRVPQDDGSYKSLKMSIGKKKIHDKGPEGLSRMMYNTIMINGAQFCRRHLMFRCHLCQEDHTFLKVQGDDERRQLGLRSTGDPRLNERAEKWGDYVQGRQMQFQFQTEALITKYGKNHNVTHPEHWQKQVAEMTADERELNDRFLAENDDIMKNQGTSQCCYWACETPNGRKDQGGRGGTKLLKCSGCGIVKYCCKDHQLLDWKWEHKGECTTNVPTWLKEEYEQDRLNNLNGSYEDYKTV